MSKPYWFGYGIGALGTGIGVIYIAPVAGMILLFIGIAFLVKAHSMSEETSPDLFTHTQRIPTLTSFLPREVTVPAAAREQGPVAHTAFVTNGDGAFVEVRNEGLGAYF